MRPELLTMQAFGSYGAAVTIDFRKAEQNLFLITGDTGAGKTTIFDALVFALYGEASSTSNKKDGTELQSQFVSPELEPYVELTFTEHSGEGEDTYTVRRSPQHRRPLKRKGKNDEKLVGERVDLTLPEGMPYIGSLRETNAKIQEILGLTKSQFMQVAMIAQGEFMELLRADSADKKEIFRKLFGTDLYRNITEELRTRRAKAWDEVEELGHYFVAETGHVVIPDTYAGQEELARLQSGILGRSELSSADAEAFVQGLESLTQWLQTQQKETDGEYLKARAARDAARDAYNAAESLAGFYRQYDQAQLELEQCEAETERMQGKARLRTEILSAQEIRGAYKHLRAAERTAEETAGNLQTQETALPGLQEAAGTAAERDRNARGALQAETEAYSKTGEKVRAALHTFSRIAALEKEAEEARGKQETARTGEKRADEALQALEQQEKDWRTQLEQYRDLEGRRTAWTFRKTEAAGIRADLAAAVEEKQTLQKQHEAGRKAGEAYGKAAALYDESKAAYDAMYRAYLDAQAGFLAAQLQPGRPCPVCGSTAHPHPCTLPDNAGGITRETLQEADRQLSARKKQQEKCAADAHAAEQLYQEKKARHEETMERLRGRFAANFPNVPEQLRLQEAADLLNALLASLQEEDRTMKKQEQAAEALRNSLEGVEARREALRADKTAASQAFAEADSALTARLSALEQLRGTAEYPDAQSAKDALAKARALYEEKKEQAAETAKVLQGAQAALERAQALIRQFSEELPSRQEAAQQLRRSYEELLTEKSLSEDTWKDLAQRYQAADAERLQKEIDAHSRRKASAESALKVSSEAIASRERPSLGRLEEARDAAEKHLAETEAIKTQIGSSLTADLHAFAQLGPGLQKWESRREVYQRLSRLYRQLAGRNPGQRMDIETFVQRYYLERILDAANARFLDMSAGQFELRMCDLDRAGEGKNRGLDLMVYSTVTGKEREVRTLSGGESFMAALSLALGMADQIRENAANVNLDILFIDEGFGSLDNHSREQAVKVLQQMAGGSRLIGIISHVTEMKQEIEDQLVVSKDEAGSHVRWMQS